MVGLDKQDFLKYYVLAKYKNQFALFTKGEGFVERIQSVSRCLDIIECIAQRPIPPTVQELSNELHLSKNTIYNILGILTNRGYIAKNSRESTYRLGERFSEICFPQMGKEMCALQTMPLLEQLYNSLGQETCYLAYFKDYQYFLVAQVLSTKGLSCGPLADCRDMHATSLGKVYLSTKSTEEIRAWARQYGLPKIMKNTITDIDTLLAEIETVRRQGYAENREENTEGIYSVSVIIHAKPLMGLSFTIPTIRYDVEQVDTWVKALKNYALGIEKRLNIGRFS